MCNSPRCVISIGYKEKHLEDTVNTKFLGLQTDNHLKWKNHFDQVNSTLSGACYAVRSTFHFSKIMPFKSTILLIFTLWQSMEQYAGVICSTVERYLLYKRKLLYWWLIKNLELHVEMYWVNKRCYLFHANMNFNINNQENFQTYSSVHNINIGKNHYLPRPNDSL